MLGGEQDVVTCMERRRGANPGEKSELKVWFSYWSKVPGGTLSPGPVLPCRTEQNIVTAVTKQRNASRQWEAHSHTAWTHTPVVLVLVSHEHA